MNENYIGMIYKNHKENFEIPNTEKRVVLDDKIKLQIQKLQKEIEKLQNSVKSEEQEYNIFLKYDYGRTGPKIFDLNTRVLVSEDSIEDLDFVINVAYAKGLIEIPVDIKLDLGIVYLQLAEYKITGDKLSLKMIDSVSTVDLLKIAQEQSWRRVNKLPLKYLYYKLYGEKLEAKTSINERDLLGCEKIFRLKLSQKSKQALIDLSHQTVLNEETNLKIPECDKTLNQIYCVDNDLQRRLLDERGCLTEWKKWIYDHYASGTTKFYAKDFDKFIYLYDKLKEYSMELDIYRVDYSGSLWHISRDYVESDLLQKSMTFQMFVDTIIRLVINEGYLSLQQCARDLFDYIKMYHTCNNEILEIEGNFEGLKLKHDILAREYNIKLDTEKEELFKRNQSVWKEKTIGNYNIIVPLTSDEIKQEAMMQNNCVATYISRIVKGETSVLFMREKNNINKSYITIQISNGVLCQAKRSRNRLIDEADYEVLKEYAKSQDIKIDDMRHL